MARRNDDILAAALHSMTEAMREIRNQNAGNAEQEGLDRFLRRHPPVFKGGHDHNRAHVWIQELEKIFEAMQCPDNQKVIFSVYQLREEAEHWWRNTRQRLINGGVIPTWAIFRQYFLGKYFPESMKHQKIQEFMELKQGNMTVGEYTTRFEDLAQYFPYYENMPDEREKCVKFENGLRPELSMVFAPQEIRCYATLVNKCKIYEEKAKLTQPRNMGPQRHDKKGFFNKKKPYTRPSNYSRQSSRNYHSGYSTEGASRHGIGGGNQLRCGKCGKPHLTTDCKERSIICFKCGKPGHISRECTDVKRENSGPFNSQANCLKTIGRVYTLSGEEAAQ